MDNLYDEYEEILNQRLDDVDVLIQDVINSVNDNSSEINATIQSVAESVGYSLSSTMDNILNNDESMDIVSGYCDNFSEQLTTVNDTLGSINEYIKTMEEASDSEADSDIKNTGTGGGTSGDTGGGTGGSGSDSGSGSSTDKELQEQLKKIIKKGTKRSKTLTSSEKKNHHQLWKYIVKKYGYAPNNKIYNYLAGALGVSVNPNNITSAKKDKILTKFKAAGMSQGGIVGELQHVADINGDDSITVNTLKTGEAVLTERQTTEIQGLLGSLDKLQNMANICNNAQKCLDNKSSLMQKNIMFDIDIPIEHVEDYNDLVNQMRKDNQFERFIRSITVDRLAGYNNSGKQIYKWK